MSKYQSVEAKRERIAELETLISGTEKGIRSFEDYITRCDLANAEADELIWDTEDTRRLLVKTYRTRAEYQSERWALIEELTDLASDAARALTTEYEEVTNGPAEYHAAYKVARAEIVGTRPATAEHYATVADMVEAIAQSVRDDMPTGPRTVYQPHELEAFLGEYIEDYDVEAIKAEATEYDPRTGNRFWIVGPGELWTICQRHDLTVKES